MQLLHNNKKNQIEIEGQFQIEDIDENIAYNVANYARAQISPMCSFWGGIVCQEIIKITGKYTPLRQWLHYDVFECLPKDEVSRSLLNTRYDDFISIFGNELLEKFKNQRIFLIGAGALGCEYLKMLSLMGVCCGEKSRLYCTDDDNIAVIVPNLRPRI